MVSCRGPVVSLASVRWQQWHHWVAARRTQAGMVLSVTSVWWQQWRAGRSTC